MKNIKFLLLSATILSISACEMPEYRPLHGSDFDAGPAVVPVQHTQCDLVPQFSFEKDEALEIIIECEEETSY